MIVICYDIACNRRRYRVDRCLEAYGARVQKSIYECHLSEQTLSALKQELDTLIHAEEDSLLFYSLCPRDYQQVSITGQGELSHDWDYQLY